MLNFTVGPVTCANDIASIGGEQIPYFRTAEFSALMKENEALIRSLSGAPENSRAVFITGSGTASMEAAVANVLTPEDKALVINGGSFGARFAELCAIHSVPFEELRKQSGAAVTAEDLARFAGRGFTALLVNIHETSTGVLYDGALLADFCKNEGLLFIVDAISSFLADPFDMKALGADVMIAGSQKALACPPGVSALVLSPRAVERISEAKPHCMYLDLRRALSDGERGQTPFTPAVGILRQLNARLRGIAASGGASSCIAHTADIARDFREKIKDLTLSITSSSLSNAVTPLSPANANAYDVFLTLKDEYSIWVCPNGGDLRDTVFRVGHIGALTTDDNTVLTEALRDLSRRGRL